MAARQLNLITGVSQTPAEIECLRALCESFGFAVTILPDISGSLDGKVPDRWIPTAYGGTRVEDIRRMGEAGHTLVFGEHMRVAGELLAEGFALCRQRKCIGSVTGYEALQAAIADCRGETWADDHEEGALLCKCFGVDEGMLDRAIRNNRLTTTEAVTAFTKAGGGCFSCFNKIEDFLAETNRAMVAEGLLAEADAFRPGGPVDIRAPKAKAGRPPIAPAAPMRIGLEPLPMARQNVLNHPAPRKVSPLAPAGAASALTNLQRIRLVEQAIEDLRPLLRRDGGDCELVDVDGSTVSVRLSGACVGCQMASVTISGVQQRFVEKVGLPFRVIPVQ